MHASRTLRIPISILLAGSVALLLGCGGSSSSPPTSSAGQAASTPAPIAASAGTNTSRRAQWAAFAEAVNLRPSDLPGFTAKVKTPKHHPDEASRYGACFALNNTLKPVFKAESDAFKSGEPLRFEQTGSSTSVMASTAASRAEIAIARREIRSPAARSCITAIFAGIARKAGGTKANGRTLRVTVGAVHLSPVDVSSATRGTGGGVGISISVGVTYVVTGGGRSVTVPVTLYADELMFAVGRATVSLGSLGLNELFPAELESHLFSVLVERASAASRAFPAVAS
jgi:hypothetical protein